MGYIALEMVDGLWGIYRRNGKNKLRTLVASGLSSQSAKSIARKACNSPMFDKAAVVRCGGVWH